MMSVDTSPICDRIQETIATGERANADHLASCAACRGVAEAARRAGDLRAGETAPLSPGFRARLMAGGKARFAQRRRRRRTFSALGAAAAAGGLWMALSTAGHQQVVPAQPVAATPDRAYAAPAGEIDALLAPAARWDYVEEPLEPYRQLAGSIEAADSDTGGAP